MLPVFISLLLIAAHLQRAGYSALAVGCLAVSGLLYFTHPFSVRAIQLILMLAVVEWSRTLLYLVNLRIEAGMDWGRLALILGVVTIFTACSLLVFKSTGIRRKYGLDR